MEKKGTVHTLPCYRQCQNISSSVERERQPEREMNFISAKAFKLLLRGNSNAEQAYLGLIRKLHDGRTEEANSDAPFDLLKLKKTDIPTIIWEALEHYAEVFSL